MPQKTHFTANQKAQIVLEMLCEEWQLNLSGRACRILNKSVHLKLTRFQL